MMWLSRNKKDGQVLVRFQSPHLFVSWKHGGSKTLRKTKLLISCLKDIHSQDKEMLSHQLGFEMPGIDHDLLDIQRYRNRKKSTRQVSPLSMSYKTTSNSCIDKNVDMNRQTKLYLIQSCLPSSETTFLWNKNDTFRCHLKEVSSNSLRTTWEMSTCIFSSSSEWLRFLCFF